MTPTESTEPAGRSEEEALRQQAAEAHWNAWSLNTADREGWDDQVAHNRGMSDAAINTFLAAGYRSPAQVREARAEGWDECVRLNGLSSALGLPRRANPYRADSLSTDGGEGA